MFRVKTLAGALALALVLPAVGGAQQIDTGQANFTRYVAIGDSLTAGFQSGSLYRSSQINSYPALIHRQATGQATGFEQPLVSDPGIPGRLVLRSLAPLSITPSDGQGAPTNLTLQRPYNNMAVPGARVRDVLVTTTGGLHDVVLRRSGTALQQALALSPTFVTIWIGNNDALAAATSGVVVDNVTLTTVDRFETDFRAIVDAVAATGARMAIANIPAVTTIPYVTTIPSVVVNPATNQPVLIGGNPVPLIGPNGLLGAGDRVLLPASSLLAQGIGIPAALGGKGTPLPDSAVLSAAEIATISARVDAFNNVIRTVAQQRNAAFIDANGLLREVAQRGVPVGGVTFSAAFLTGGIFSYDGVHPTSFGYAYIANAFIEAINRQFGAEIEPVNLYPFVFGTSSTQAARGTAAGMIDLGLDDLGTPAFIFTAEAQKNLLWALRAETPKKRPRGRKK
jgi:lysophospholipase L1-like esterase